jgi:hypothetical protein
MKRRARIIMGSALGLAAIAVAIDHTRHRVPLPVATQDAAREGPVGETPCGLGAAPCGAGGESTPCGLGSSPCNL